MTLHSLAPERGFAPAELDAGDLAALEPLFSALRDREFTSAAAVVDWLRDESELLSAYHAEVARRYIAMTCQTDSEAARESYLAIERDVTPRVKVMKDELDRLVLDSPALKELGPRYDLLIKGRRAAAEIFRPDNTELESLESELQTKQQEIRGALTVQFRGVEHTLQEMGRYLEDPDRELRHEAFRASLDARRASWDELEVIFDKLIELRAQMARNAGFDHYTPYRFKQLQRFDYDPQTCLRFHDAIERTVVPAVLRLNAARRAKLGVDTLRPWDLDVDPGGRSSLRPFESQDELIELVSTMFGRVDSRFRKEFGVLVREQLLDLMSRKGKAPGGYQYTLEDVRLPFIFANAVGTHRDVQTMLHEGGHAFHAILSRDEPLLDYRVSPIEFAETASMSMELMGLEQLVGVYGEADARHARVSHLEGILRILPWIASIDAFQHWIYANPNPDHAARAAQWRAIRARFAPGIDYEGLEDALTYQWIAQAHLFNHAFYYIEYGIAQVAALQVWRNYRRTPLPAVEAYRAGLSLGGSQPLPALFEAAGVNFDFSEAILGELVADVEATLKQAASG